jgi:hypothetical protein
MSELTAHTQQKVAWNSTEQRAITLLGNGLGPEQVATAVGVTASRISQLLSDHDFATAVAELRFQNLQKHNEIDASYDLLEEQLIEKLADVLPLMMRPMEILKAIQIVNGAKRRGQSAPEQITHQNTVVNLVMPTQIIQKFQMNSNNLITNVGSQTLETIQSSRLLEGASAVGAGGTKNGNNIIESAPAAKIQSHPIRD